MSHTNNVQTFPLNSLQEKLISEVQKILRREYENLRHAVKTIGKRTGLRPRTIRNWYEGRNVPESAHLLLLAIYYPNIMRVILEITGYSGLQLIQGKNTDSPNIASSEEKNRSFWEVYSAKSCTINVTLDVEKAVNLNQRQLWFLGLIQQGYDLKATDIATFWKVSARAAKYDVRGLANLRLIEFTGAKKRGWYIARTVTAT